MKQKNIIKSYLTNIHIIAWSIKKCLKSCNISCIIIFSLISCDFSERDYTKLFIIDTYRNPLNTGIVVSSMFDTTVFTFHNIKDTIEADSLLKNKWYLITYRNLYNDLLYKKIYTNEDSMYIEIIRDDFLPENVLERSVFFDELKNFDDSLIFSKNWDPQATFTPKYIMKIYYLDGTYYADSHYSGIRQIKKLTHQQVEAVRKVEIGFRHMRLYGQEDCYAEPNDMFLLRFRNDTLSFEDKSCNWNMLDRLFIQLNELDK